LRATGQFLSENPARLLLDEERLPRLASARELRKLSPPTRAHQAPLQSRPPVFPSEAADKGAASLDAFVEGKPLHHDSFLAVSSSIPAN